MPCKRSMQVRIEEPAATKRLPPKAERHDLLGTVTRIRHGRATETALHAPPRLALHNQRQPEGTEVTARQRTQMELRITILWGR